jgi:hypothetical protein
VSLEWKFDQSMYVPVGFDGACGAFEPPLVHAVGRISILGTPWGLNQGPIKGLSGPVL